MSHTSFKNAKFRLQRSELAVPGSSPKMFEKALNSDADYIFLDLEDAVSPNDKITARANIIKALNEMNWREKGKTISVRINSLDTHYMYSDLVEIVEQAGEKVDTILDKNFLYPGSYTFLWNAKDHESGTYFIQTTTLTHKSTRKVALIK